jgi:hypothetical protein
MLPSRFIGPAAVTPPKKKKKKKRREGKASMRIDTLFFFALQTNLVCNMIPCTCMNVAHTKIERARKEKRVSIVLESYID